MELSNISDGRINREELEYSGFNFDYHTHIHKVADEPVKYFCYEYGYINLNNEFCSIITKIEPQMKIEPQIEMNVKHK